MVNHGASRACETCKRRHKKCDEGKPVCNRCIKSKQTCLGYKDSSGLLFRHHQFGNAGNTATTLPIRQPAPARVQEPTPPFESVLVNLDNSTIQDRALELFFDEYVVESIDRSVSRGFFDGLRSVITFAGETSDIACAAKIVYLAGAGNRLGRPELLDKANAMYGNVLRSLSSTLSNQYTSSSMESLMTVVLLGIYEIITSTDDVPGKHVAHVRGVAALLDAENSPFSFTEATEIFQIGNPRVVSRGLKQPQGPGVLCAPILNESVQSLDAILLKFSPYYRRAGTILGSSDVTREELLELRQDTVALDKEYSTWPSSQPAAWQPRNLGVVGNHQVHFPQGSDWWPGNIDSYFDLYVAAVWNTYRKTHMMVLDVIVRCTLLLGEEHSCEQERERARELGSDIIASVPYHLSNDVEKFFRDLRTGLEPMAPGKPAGGLLLMHPLLVVTKVSVLSREMQDHARDRLAWIWKNMGIGQAKLLSSLSPGYPFRYFAMGHTLIWAGMLIRPF